MDRYIPADALAFIEINSVTDVADGLTDTKAWRELAPVLGLSSQLRQVGSIADLIGRSGLGPDDIVVAGRAQCAIAITGIESRTGESEEGAFIHLKPDFALIVETHAKPEVAERLVRERASLIAQRLYGESVVGHTDEYRGVALSVFQGPEATRQLVVSTTGSVIIVANQTDAVKMCLDTIAGRSPALADDVTLKERRGEVGRDPYVFAYVTPRGMLKFAELWPLLIAGRSADPETISLVGELIEHISNQTGAGLLYSSNFEDGGVTEKYLTLLRSQVADALSQPLKPSSAAGFTAIHLIPRTVEGVTLIKVERAGELPERILKQLSPNLDLVAGVALREFVIAFRKQYGLEPSDSVGDAVGDEIAVTNFVGDQPRAIIFRVTDKARLAPAVNRYLTRRGQTTTTESYNGTEITVSSGDERRAAAFVDDYLVLGTRDQIGAMIDTNAKGEGLDGDEQLKKRLALRPAEASIISYRPRSEDAGKLLLAVSKVTRVTDGSPELLEREDARKALGRLPASISFTEFRSYGVFTQTRSAVGNFSALASLIGGN